MKVSNPLTIIAIFAGLAEALATVALLGLPKALQEIFLYFVMAFPSLIVILFFIVLYFKNHVLYAPGDYQNPEHYLKVNNVDIKQLLTSELSKSRPKVEQEGVLINTELGSAGDSSELAKKSLDIAREMTEDLFSPTLELLVFQLLEKPGKDRDKIINSIKSDSLRKILVSILEKIKTQVGEDSYNKPIQPTAKASAD